MTQQSVEIALEMAQGVLERACSPVGLLAALNQQGIEAEWEFNEWCHGRTGRPMGYPHQAWSAGMYIFAYRFVEDGKLPAFNVNDGW